MSQAQADLAISLFAAHVISDFVFQTDRDVKAKRQGKVLLRHCIVVALLSYLLAGLWQAWVIPLTILLTHLAIDFVKTNWSGAGGRSFVVDQFAHLGVICALVYIFPPITYPAQASLWHDAGRGSFYPALLVVAGFITTVQAGSVVVGLGVEPFLMEQIQEGVSRADPGAEAPLPTRRGFEQGGKVIGQLERAMIFVLILAGEPSAIGFLIAAKSLLRFGDIGAGASRKEVEYIIIGTFMSFLFALLVSYLTHLAFLAYRSAWPAA